MFSLEPIEGSTGAETVWFCWTKNRRTPKSVSNTSESRDQKKSAQENLKKMYDLVERKVGTSELDSFLNWHSDEKVKRCIQSKMSHSDFKLIHLLLWIIFRTIKSYINSTSCTLLWSYYTEDTFHTDFDEIKQDRNPGTSFKCDIRALLELMGSLKTNFGISLRNPKFKQ